MSAKRLSDWDRRQILDKIMKHRFNESREARKKALADFGRKLYDHFFPKTVQEQLAALPGGWVEYGQQIEVKIGSEVGSFILAVPVPKKPDWRFHRACIGVITARDPLADEWAELQAAELAAENQETEAQAAARSLLYRATSLSALLKQWPEVKPFTGHFGLETEADRSLPVVQVEKANELLGLPADEEEPTKE